MKETGVFTFGEDAYRRSEAATLVKEDVEGRAFIIYIPGAEKSLRVGAEEAFLIEALSSGVAAADILVRFDKQFGQALDQDSLRQFVEQMVAVGIFQPFARARQEAAHALPRCTAEAALGADARTVSDDQRTGDSEPLADGIGRPSVASSPPLHWRWGDPGWIVCRIARFLPDGWPDFGVIFLLGTLGLGGLVLVNDWYQVVAAIKAISPSLGWLPHFILALLIVNLTSVLAQGGAIHKCHGKVQDFGVKVTLGVLRFYISNSATTSMFPAAYRYCHLVPLLARLVLVALALIVWVLVKRQGIYLSDLAVMIGITAFISFLINANPLWPGNGYHLLASWLGQPKLRQRSFDYVKLVWNGQAVPSSVRPTDRRLYLVYAVLSGACSAAVASIVLILVGQRLESQYSGAGVLATLALAGAAAYILVSRRRYRAGKNVQPAVSRRTLSDSRGRILLAVVFALGFFIPYPYETGGAFSVLPALRADVRAEVEGQLQQVLVREGQRVAAGDPVASLTEWRFQQELSAMDAELDKAKAELKVLLLGATEEEIERARRQVEAERVKMRFAFAALERSRQLAQEGFISSAALDADERALEDAKADVAVAQASLAAVSSQARAPEVEAAQAKVDSLIHNRTLLQIRLDKVRLVAPISGRVITPRPDFMVGKYLDEGDLFVQIEDITKARVEIEIPESDIGLVEVGKKVRLRPWAGQGQEIHGQVEAIAPIAEIREFGNVVRITALVDNEREILKSSMTGFGKVSTVEMCVNEAFTRMLVRFALIEMWSWLP